jgi:hypothetical protein
MLVLIFAVLTPGSTILAASPIFRLDAAPLRAIFVVVINVALPGPLFGNRLIRVTWNGHKGSLRVAWSWRDLNNASQIASDRRDQRFTVLNREVQSNARAHDGYDWMNAFHLRLLTGHPASSLSRHSSNASAKALLYEHELGRCEGILGAGLF